MLARSNVRCDVTFLRALLRFPPPEWTIPMSDPQPRADRPLVKSVRTQMLKVPDFKQQASFVQGWKTVDQARLDQQRHAK